MLTISDLMFDPVTHQTTAPDGHDVPHVTHVLAETGLATDFDLLASLSTRLDAAITARCQLGSVVHADTHAYDDDDLDWATVDSRALPYVQAWAQFRSAYDLEPLAHARERYVYSPIHDYVGILDGVFIRHRAGSRVCVLIDLKLGDPEDSGCAYQTSAYEAAWLDTYPEQAIDERWAVQLVPGRRVPWLVTNYTDNRESWQDFTVFQAALTTYRHQVARRR